jgi:hypothetical protein
MCVELTCTTTCNHRNDAPPNFSKGLNSDPRTKQRKKNIIGACFLTCNTSKVGRCVGAPGWD